MKVLQINNCHYRRGGADVVFLDTVSLLAENGIDVMTFSTFSENNLNSKQERFFPNSLNAINASVINQILSVPKSLYSRKAEKCLQLLINSSRPDIAHIHLYKGELTLSILKVLKRNRIPIVISLHDYGFLCPRNILFDADGRICEKCISGSTLNCIIKRCNRKNLMYSTVNYLEYNLNNSIINPEKYFDKVISVSKFNYNLHKKSKKWLGEKLTHLYNFTPDLDHIRPNHKKGNYILYFGRLSKNKGIETLVRAVGNSDSGLTLLVVGTGPLSYLSENVAPNVKFMGYRQGEELRKLISNASFIVVPSEWYENNPMTIIEAYANGKPVIGSNIGGIPEIVVPNETGFLFEMGNANDLATCLDIAHSIDEESYIKMSISAYNFAQKHFNPKVYINELLSIYNSVLYEYETS